jgi:hypothetical protein
MMADLKTYSVLIRWDDNDLEQGEFGEIVRATSAQHAERIVRARMIRTHWQDYREEWESRWDSLSSYRNSDGSYFGTVVDCHEGAIWKAKELEDALRGLLRQVDETANRMGWADHGEREAARKIINEIDTIGQ